MIMLVLGAGALLVMTAALGMFSRAQVATVKSFGIWIAGIGGLALAAMLFLTGRGAAAIGALVVLGPMIWSWRGEWGRKAAGPAARSGGGMSREDAYAVLGLPVGASSAQVLEAHRRLMRAAHPDQGGSDWLAARINQARDALI